MFDIQSIIIYLSLFTIMSLIASKARKEDSWFYIIIAVLIYSIVFGMRYKVGVDYMSYFNDYKYASFSTYNLMRTHYEPGFQFIMLTLIGFKAHFSWFFGVVAFLQLYLVFKSLKDDPDIYQFLVFTFIIGCVWLTYANGLRQQLAFCLFAYSLCFVEKNKWLLYYIIIAISISIHNSATVLAIMYPILRYNEDWFKNINTKIQLLSLFIAIILGNIGIVQKYFGLLETYASFLGYGRFFSEAYDGAVYTPLERKGIGYYVTLLLNVILVANSTRYKEYFDKKYVYYIYNLYFIGVLLFYSCMGSLFIWRLNYYFYGFAYIVGAYAILYAKNNSKYLYYSLVGMYMLIFIATMYGNISNTSLFRFYWQVPGL